MQVKHTTSLLNYQDALFCYGVMGNQPDKLQILERAKEFLNRSSGHRVFGSSVLMLCYIATHIDAYNQGLVGPWDAAGGILLIEKAVAV